MATAFAIKVENSVPVPTGSARVKYPFRSMAPGDSFFVPGASAARLINASQNYKREGMRFTVRTEAGGARVWRTA